MSQLEGKAFEDIFQLQCRRSGYHAEKNYLTARHGWNGKLIAVHSNLDFTVVDPRRGRVGYFDCKSFEGSYFTHSHIIKDNRNHQLERAERYNNWNVPAGFVVWLRQLNQVIFFSGLTICKIGQRARFDTDNGVSLGKWSEFEIRPIFSSPSGCAVGSA